MPTDAARLIDIRDNLKKTNPNNPQIPEINYNIQTKINDYRRKKWRDHLDSCEQGSKKLWDTIKSFGNQPRQPDNQAIFFNGRATKPPKKLNVPQCTYIIS